MAGMRPEERRRYLANLLLTLPDRKPAGRAADLFDRIADEIGAPGEDRAAAFALAAGKDYRPVFPTRYSDRVRNVEDMLLFAMLDDKLSPQERDGLLEAQRRVGIDPNGWTRIGEECRARKLEWDACETKVKGPPEVDACARRRESATAPDRYCIYGGAGALSIFGCAELRMEWSGLSGWFAYGAFVEDGAAWVFDRERIRAEIALRTPRLARCPHFDPELAQIAVELLPERVTPEADPDWAFRRSFIEKPGTVARMVKVQVGTLVEERRFIADGVRPTSNKVASQILNAARAKRGLPAVEL